MGNHLRLEMERFSARRRTQHRKFIMKRVQAGDRLAIDEEKRFAT